MQPQCKLLNQNKDVFHIQSRFSPGFSDFDTVATLLINRNLPFEVTKPRPVANYKVANYRPNIPMTLCSFCGVENDYLMKDYIGQRLAIELQPAFFEATLVSFDIFRWQNVAPVKEDKSRAQILSACAHRTAFKFCRPAHLLNTLLMSKINLHISSNFLKLLCIEKRCFQSEAANTSNFLCFIN